MIGRRLREYARVVAVIVGFMVVSAACGAYILNKQRLRTPLQDRYSVKVQLGNSLAVTPGLGQPVNVAGVRVGDISGVSLKDGRALVTLSIDPAKLPRVRTDARAVLVPNTPLKDMQIELYPGRAPAPPISHGGFVPVVQTQTPVDADELTTVLDADTRAYFQTLASAAQGGLRGRGADVRAMLRALGPTTAQVRQISDLLAVRRVKLARLVHNLALLTRAGDQKDRELGQVVAAGDATLHSVASQDAALRGSIARLPETLAAARSSVGHLTTFAGQLRPTLTALQPTARRLPAALRAVKPVLAAAEPLIRRQLRPFTREAQPLARDLGPATRDLSAVTPDLINSFKVLNYVANELVFNPPGDDEGYLFWTAWFFHNTDSLFGIDDAHGASWRVLGLVSCATLAGEPTFAPILQAITGAVPVCPP